MYKTYTYSWLWIDTLGWLMSAFMWFLIFLLAVDNWYNGPGYGDGSGWGYNEFIPFSDLKDSSKGFLVNDVLMVQVEIEAISSTKYFPS